MPRHRAAHPVHPAHPAHPAHFLISLYFQDCELCSDNGVRPERLQCFLCPSALLALPTLPWPSCCGGLPGPPRRPPLPESCALDVFAQEAPLTSFALLLPSGARPLAWNPTGHLGLEGTSRNSMSTVADPRRGRPPRQLGRPRTIWAPARAESGRGRLPGPFWHPEGRLGARSHEFLRFGMNSGEFIDFF